MPVCPTGVWGMRLRGMGFGDAGCSGIQWEVGDFQNCFGPCGCYNSFVYLDTRGAGDPRDPSDTQPAECMTGMSFLTKTCWSLPTRIACASP